MPKKPMDKLNDLAKEFFTNRAHEAKLDAAKKKFTDANKSLAIRILEILENHDIEGAKTDFGSVSTETKLYAKIENYQEFFNWVAKTNSIEFLPKSVNIAVVRQMMAEQNVVPPGLTLAPVTKLASRIKSSFKAEVLAE
jgi:hypothetical protein